MNLMELETRLTEAGIAIQHRNRQLGFKCPSCYSTKTLWFAEGFDSGELSYRPCGCSVAAILAKLAPANGNGVGPQKERSPGSFTSQSSARKPSQPSNNGYVEHSERIGLGDLAQRLSKVRWRGNDAFSACCPAHEDHEPSLSVSLKNDRILLHCHVGCSFDAIVGALGLEPKDFSSHQRNGYEAPRRAANYANSNGSGGNETGTTGTSGAPGRETRYEYRDGEGNVIATHVRLDYPDQPKRMWWEPKGVKTAALPLWGAARLTEASEGDAVIVCEGERCADSLWERRHLAVGTATGASGTPSDETLKALLPFRVYLWADNDDAGRVHMARIAKRLAELATKEIRLIEWQSAPEHGDAADYDGDPNCLMETAELTGDPVLATIDHALVEVVSANALSFGVASQYLESMREERGKSVELCEGLLRTRNLSLLVGRAWAGKTTVAVNLTRSLLLGQAFLGRPCRGDTRIAYLALERNGSEVAEQFERWGIADRIFFLDRVPLGDPREMARALAYEIHKKQVEITIVDHLVGMIHLEDGNDYVGVSRALAPFNAIAKYTCSHVFLLHHQPKTAGTGSEINVMGSEAFRAATDCLLEASKIGQNYFFRAQSRGVPDVERLRLFRRDDGLLDAEPGVDGLKAEILAVLASAESPVTSKGILELSPELKSVPLRNVQMALKRLAEDNQIIREGKGKPRSPFYYSVMGSSNEEKQKEIGSLFDRR